MPNLEGVFLYAEKASLMDTCIHLYVLDNHVTHAEAYAHSGHRAHTNNIQSRTQTQPRTPPPNTPQPLHPEANKVQKIPMSEIESRTLHSKPAKEYFGTVLT
mmetsp:Transcript_21264/g.38163  ORF Transcript_21264/g.38163 Transcript_21264/m.38163 type:complete len:102 (-) Transcript_21264:69-374(-)